MTVLESMQHGKSQRVINVVAHVGVENDTGRGLRKNGGRKYNGKAENQNGNLHGSVSPRTFQI
jgi:hypothetical protein